jgi:hypothetical protein
VPVVTGELTAQGLIDFRKASLTAIPTARISFPGGNTRRYSMEGSPLQSSIGIFRDRIKDMGDFDYRLSDPRGGLQTVESFIVLADMDGDIRSIVDRYGASSFKGSAVQVDTATKSAVADWRRDFTGVVDGIEPAGSKTWKLAIRVDDRMLREGTWRLPRLTSSDFPFLLPPDVEQPIPVALGVFDSRDGTVVGSTGSVPLIKLNESSGTGGYPYRYLVQAGWGSSVKRIQGLTTGTWVRASVTRNNIAMTEVWFDTDPGDDTLAAEISGIGDDVAGSSIYTAALGTGEPITNLLRQLRWLLRNYAFSSYRSGAYASDPAAIHAASWDAAESWALQRRFRGSIYIDDTSAPVDLINAVCQWAWIRAGWNRNGQMVLAPLTDVDAPYYSDTRWLRYVTKGAEAEFTPMLPSDKTVHAMRSSTWQSPALGASRSIVSVRDARITGNTVSEINHPLGVARQEFQDGYPGPGNLVVALNGSRPGVQGDGITLRHGSPLYRWRDVNWSPNDATQDFGGSPGRYRVELTPVAPAGNEPTFRLGELNGHSFVRFDGTNDYMDSAAPFTVVPELTIHAVIRLNAAPAAKAVNANDDNGIITDSAGYWGLHCYTNGGLYYVSAVNHDGALASVGAQVALDTWLFVRMRRFGTNLSLSVNHWDEVSTPSGATTALTANIRLGSQYSGLKFFNGDIAAAFVYSSGDLSNQGALAGNATPALGGNYDIWRALTDRYRK